MARIRSARKQDAPLSTPRRKTSPLPASARISAPSFRTRRAICRSLNAFLIRRFNGYLVQLAAARDLDGFRDLHTAHAGDGSMPYEQRKPVADLEGDFTINQEILQLFLPLHAEGLEAIALAAVADGECGVASGRDLDCLSCRLPVAGCR